jgi:hypothetical protein
VLCEALSLEPEMSFSVLILWSCGSSQILGMHSLSMLDSLPGSALSRFVKQFVAFGFAGQTAKAFAHDLLS